MSPSIAYSSAGRSSAGVSCATCATRQRRGEIDLALVGVQLAAQQREQARLARAVRADQADLVARVERDVGAFEQDRRAPGGRGASRGPAVLGRRQFAQDQRRAGVLKEHDAKAGPNAASHTTRSTSAVTSVVPPAAGPETEGLLPNQG